MTRLLVATAVVPGEARGEALVSSEPLSFWGGYDQLTGEIIDRRHPLSGANARGKVLVIPASRGSSTATAVLLEAVRNGTQPAAIVCAQVDRFFALASIVAQEMYGKGFAVLMVGAAEFAELHSGEQLAISTDGRITVDDPLQ